MAQFRSFETRDLKALYAISLATGLAGADASRLYKDPDMMGHIYAAPYALLNPGLVLVAEDAAGPAGFAVGSLDTAAWERKLEREWWPALRRQYADPSDVPAACWTSDQRRAFMIHYPALTPAMVAKNYPAHLHMNLLPRIQGRGVGSKLFEAWRAMARAQGADAMHVAVNHANARAVRFWANQGFETLSLDQMPSGRTIWMGRG